MVYLKLIRKMGRKKGLEMMITMLNLASAPRKGDTLTIEYKPNPDWILIGMGITKLRTDWNGNYKVKKVELVASDLQENFENNNFHYFCYPSYNVYVKKLK